MADDTRFEARLAVALDRYAELAPAMDDEAVARDAIDAGGRRWATRWAGALGTLGGRAAPGGLRLAYMVALVALLLAIVVMAMVAGTLLRSRPGPLGGNGAIVYSFGGNGHAAVAAVALGPDGTGGRPIAAGRCPAWSRDGKVLTWVAYDGSAELVVARPDGTETARLPLVDDPQQSVSAVVSPDGKRVAWFKPAQADAPSAPASELWVASLDGAPATRIVPASDTPGESYGAPLWSPDGGRIAFGTFVRDGATGELRRTAIDVVAADGTDRRRLTNRPGVLDDGMSWSPDGAWLAYVGVPDGSTPSMAADDNPPGPLPRDLFVIGADGSGDRNLTGTPVTEHRPEWSPDGGSIAFLTSSDGEADHLTILEVEAGSAGSQPRPGPATDWFVWAPDGRQLLWQELTATGQERVRTTLHAIDREFRQPSTTLQVVDGLVVCPPSWQRLDP